MYRKLPDDHFLFNFLGPSGPYLTGKAEDTTHLHSGSIGLRGNKYRLPTPYITNMIVLHTIVKKIPPNKSFPLPANTKP